MGESNWRAVHTWNVVETLNKSLQDLIADEYQGKFTKTEETKQRECSLSKKHMRPSMYGAEKEWPLSVTMPISLFSFQFVLMFFEQLSLESFLLLLLFIPLIFDKCICTEYNRLSTKWWFWKRWKACENGKHKLNRSENITVGVSIRVTCKMLTLLSDQSADK